MTKLRKIFTKKLIKSIIVCLLLFIIPYIGIKMYFSPFKTNEQKTVKPIYNAAMKGISEIKLTWVLIEKEDHTVRYDLKLRNKTNSQDFTEQEIAAINQAVEQLIEYINTEDNLNYLYNDYCLYFHIDNTPTGISCWVMNNNGQYVFSSAHSESNRIADFYQMKNVQVISIEGGGDILKDEEKLNKFSELHELKEIYFRANLSEADLKQFYRKMKSILPQCKIFAGEDKVEITD